MAGKKDGGERDRTTVSLAADEVCSNGSAVALRRLVFKEADAGDARV